MAVKRWFRDLGNYLVLLIPLSDRLPYEAVVAVLRRLCYILISLSVLLIKYFPATSRSYDNWTGIAQIVGPTTGKNLLGVIALLSGIFFFWDTLTRLSSWKERETRLILLVNIGFMAMTAWLINLASSTTAYVCLLLGCLVIFAANTKIMNRNPWVLKVMIPVSFAIYLILALGFDMSGQLAGAVGKDPTLTDRTKIWHFVLRLDNDPILGAGYESFWLGDRLQAFWQGAGLGRINEAHNGYLEVYLQLGYAGLSLLLAFLVNGYGRICKALRPSSPLASFGLALWITLLFFSVTEAGFRSNLIWLVFLLCVISIPGRPQYTPMRCRGGKRSLPIPTVNKLKDMAESSWR